MRTKPYGWPTSHRLRKRREILPVQRGGTRRRGRWLTICLRPNDLGHPRVALAVSKKVGKAPTRNRVKRLLRDVFRHLVDDLGGVDVVAIAKPSLAGRSHQDVQREVLRLLGDESPRRPRY